MNKTLILSVLLPVLGFAQNFQARFDSLFQTGDSIATRLLLQEWEEQDPQNPELFTSYFNYYFQQARQEYLAMSKAQPRGESFQIKDSTGALAGFLGSEIRYDAELFAKGLSKIEEGIRLYPNRLDMRFGKIYAYGQLEAWEEFSREIIRAIQYSAENKNAWTWTNDEPVAMGEEMFLSSIQDYQIQLYNTEQDSLLLKMREIAQAVLQQYPTHIESLSNLSITHILVGEYDLGLVPLKKAEELNPSDGIVLSNIAQAYKLKGDTSQALDYYQKMLKLENPQAVDFARQQIEELNKP